VAASDNDVPSPAQRFAAEAVKETLARSTDVDSCMALASRIDSLLDQAFSSFQEAGAGLACRAGCNFCCHLRVMVYPHEAIALFRFLRSRIAPDVADGIRTRLLENADRISKLSRDGSLPTGIACAFLVDGKCGAYEVRPAACSGYHSLSREQCERSYQSAGSADIPVSQGLRYVAAALDDGMDQALKAAGLSTTSVELQTAVAALIRNPALIERWRSGRELLKKPAPAG
jgi:Fe-S-cluster containining protein